jgi:hypothetical protein
MQGQGRAKDLLVLLLPHLTIGGSQALEICTTAVPMP